MSVLGISLKQPGWNLKLFFAFAGAFSLGTLCLLA